MTSSSTAPTAEKSSSVKICPVIKAITEMGHDCKLETKEITDRLAVARTAAGKNWDPNNSLGDKNQRTALMIAIDNQNTAAVHYLLDEDKKLSWNQTHFEFNREDASKRNTLDHLAALLPHFSLTLAELPKINSQELASVREKTNAIMTRMIDHIIVRNQHPQDGLFTSARTYQVFDLLLSCIQYWNLECATKLLKVSHCKYKPKDQNNYSLITHTLTALLRSDSINSQEARRAVFFISKIPAEIQGKDIALAIQSKQIPLVAFLLNVSHRDVNNGPEKSKSFIEEAMQGKDNDMVEFLLAYPSRVNRPALKIKPTELAAFRKKINAPDKKQEEQALCPVIQAIKTMGKNNVPNKNACIEIFNQAYYESSIFGHYDVNNCKTGTQDKKTAIMLAIEYENELAVEWLLNFNPDLLYYCDYKNLSAVKRLCAFGDDMTPTQQNLVKLIFTHYMGRRFDNNKVIVPLLRDVIRQGFYDLVLASFSPGRVTDNYNRGCNVSGTTYSDKSTVITHIFWAFKRNRLTLEQVLKLHSAYEIQQESFKGIMPLDSIVSSIVDVDNLEILTVFLQRYVDPSWIVRKVFEEAFIQHNTRIMDFLITKKGANVNGAESFTYLNRAADRGDINMVKFLIEHKAKCAFESGAYSALVAAQNNLSDSPGKTRCISFLQYQKVKPHGNLIEIEKRLNDLDPDDKPGLPSRAIEEPKISNPPVVVPDFEPSEDIPLILEDDEPLKVGEVNPAFHAEQKIADSKAVSPSEQSLLTPKSVIQEIPLEHISYAPIPSQELQVEGVPNSSFNNQISQVVLQITPKENKVDAQIPQLSQREDLSLESIEPGQALEMKASVPDRSVSQMTPFNLFSSANVSTTPLTPNQELDLCADTINVIQQLRLSPHWNANTALLDSMEKEALIKYFHISETLRLVNVVEGERRRP